MKKILPLVLLTLCISIISTVAAFADDTFSACWYQTSDGVWHVYDADGDTLKNCWFCDNAVAGNGENVWYLLDQYGNMSSGALIQDGTGNYYNLETSHDGYFGKLHYEDGTYNDVPITFCREHNGSFGAINDSATIELLKAKYGVKQVSVDNSNIVYSSDILAGKKSQPASQAAEQAASQSQGSADAPPVVGGSALQGVTEENYDPLTMTKQAGPGVVAYVDNNGILNYNGKKYEVSYSWGQHYLTGYCTSGRTRSGTTTTAGRTASGPYSMLGNICYVKAVNGPAGYDNSRYNGVYILEDTGGPAVENGTESTMNTPVFDIFFNTYEEAMGVTDHGWITAEIFILKEIK